MRENTCFGEQALVDGVAGGDAAGNLQAAAKPFRLQRFKHLYAGAHFFRHDAADCEHVISNKSIFSFSRQQLGRGAGCYSGARSVA